MRTLTERNQEVAHGVAMMRFLGFQKFGGSGPKVKKGLQNLPCALVGNRFGCELRFSRIGFRQALQDEAMVRASLSAPNHAIMRNHATIPVASSSASVSLTHMRRREVLPVAW